MTEPICMAFSAPLNDQGIEQIIRDFGGTNVGTLFAPKCECTPEAAARLRDALRYHSIFITDSLVPGENLLPMIPRKPVAIQVNNVVFEVESSPFKDFTETLSILDFSRTNLDDRALEPFAGSRCLQCVTCVNTNVSLRVIQIAKTIPSLRSLGISGNGLTIADLSSADIPSTLEVFI